MRGDSESNMNSDIKCDFLMINKNNLNNSKKTNVFILKRISTLLREQNQVASSILNSFAHGFPIDKSLSFELRNRKYLGSRDRRFISENIFTFFRWWGWIREILEHSLNIRDLADNPEYLNLALELAHDFKLIIEKMPEFSLQNFRNKISEELKIKKNLLKTDKLFPDFFSKHLSYPIEIEKIMEKFQTRAPIWVRIKKDKISSVLDELSKLNVIFQRVQSVPETIKIIESNASLYSLSSYKLGFFEIQDLSSQLVGLISMAKSGEKWLDLCAGAGGKTLHLADLMENKGSITAIDKDERKLNELKRRARKGGFFNIRPILADSTKADKKRFMLYDGVIVDAPCSCSGTWRRNPDARWRYNEKDIEEFQDLQLKILFSSANYVKNGGVLIYATCSVFSLENECVVEKFLTKFPDFSLCPFKNPIDYFECNGKLHVDPSRYDSDFMFIAKFIRDN